MPIMAQEIPLLSINVVTIFTFSQHAHVHAANLPWLNHLTIPRISSVSLLMNLGHRLLNINSHHLIMDNA